MKKLAEAIILAAKIREDSFDDSKKNEEYSKLYFNVNVLYKFSLWESCLIAGSRLGFKIEKDITPIYVLLKNEYDISKQWAKSYLENDKSNTTIKAKNEIFNRARSNH